MSYNGSGTFNINTTGQPVVAGTTISAATFNALTADLATGLTTALTKDGQTTATARIPFAQGINSTLVTDASSVSTGSIITAGGVGIAKKLYVGENVNLAGLTASNAVATDASKNLVSVANTGTGSNVLATGPTIASLNLTTALTLAGAAGTNGQYLTSAGSGLPSWTTLSSTTSLVRSARTSDTILGVSDSSTLIAITSGTFTQTFTAAATLGSGWFCYIQNSGTGDITLDPNASELIDGLTSYIMYPGECRLVQCTGTAFNTVVLNSFNRTFTSSGTFTKPPGYSLFTGYLWGAGGGGGKYNDVGLSRGGGGGACVPFTLSRSVVGTTETVTIATGGAGATSDGNYGSVGGDSTFGSILTAYGGHVSGGGVLSAASEVTPGQPYLTTGARTNPGFGGGAASASIADTNSAYGGAGGAGFTGSDTAVAGGKSFWGGGGGGANGGAGGVSIFGGNGGAGSLASSGTAGTAPAGGGGATKSGTAGGAGARGEFRIGGII